ncbi:META domain-containing protein [Paracoccus sp. Z118]|uniref:META domain-containing protein n=1 Tax=Paracoccus sp. Z118 TaxID=2851017 RepID=UPI001C2BFD9F|nr:META domain-containing protein [Paracoccus sp. Z118]MBV0890322.1 META domain-containing protein [Paracoccus sp. Z118]
MKTAIRLAAATAAIAALSACEPTGAPAGVGSEGGVPYGNYVVVGFGKEAVPTRDGYVRLGPGKIEGRGPCNTFTAVNTQTLPNIHVSTMNWTDIPCGHKGFEGRLFEALTQAQQAVWEGGVLKIIGPTYITLERTGG